MLLCKRLLALHELEDLMAAREAVLLSEATGTRREIGVAAVAAQQRQAHRSVPPS